MRNLDYFNFTGKRVLLRCDLDVPLDQKGEILDDFRLQRAVPTIKNLLKRKAKIILLAHLGRPEGKKAARFSFTRVKKRLSELLGIEVEMAAAAIGQEVQAKIYRLAPGKVLLLENLRFHPGEEQGNLGFAQEVARLGDIFINDAFATCHRRHASIIGVSQFLPCGAGPLLLEEIQALSKIINALRPVIGIIGGAKTSKIESIPLLLERIDTLLVGGKLADLILRAKLICVGKPLVDLSIEDQAQKLALVNPKLRFPLDVVVSADNEGQLFVRSAGPGNIRRDENVFDIGSETIKLFSLIIGQAQSVFWVGPLGRIEKPEFTRGSLAIAQAIGRISGFKVAGGGETIQFIRSQGLTKKFSHLCVGGGAMLKYLSGEKLPGIEALEARF